MYPRNATSPEPIAIGPVVQISDGAVQTAGVTVRIKPVGVAEADGAGTTAYSTDGVVLYTPTQSETNYTSFVLIAKKTGCIPASVTVVTSASQTPGYAGVDWSKITSATSTVNLSGTTIGTCTVNTDMRGTDNALLAASYTAPLNTAGTAAAVWDAALATYTTNGSFGARVIRSTNSNNELQLTGSNHAAADIHELQAGVITAGDFSADWFTAAGIAADAVTEIQSGLATASALATLTGYVDTEVAAIKVVTDKINTGLVADGAVYQFTANMLELAPAGGGGGSGDASQATLLEVQDTVESIAASLSGVPITASGRIADGGAITIYCGDDLRIRSGSQLTLTVTDVGGTIYTRLNGIGTANLSFGASRNGLGPAAISGTIASLSQSGSGASQTLSIVVEIDGAGDYLRPAEDYIWQIESEQTHGSEVDQVVEMEGTLALRRRVV